MQRKTKTFLKTYPGPYGFYPSTEHVDRTFNVYCRTTNRDIIKSHYWDAEEAASRIAMTTILALEAMRKPKAKKPRYEAKLQETLDIFRSIYPGPYSSIQYVHDDTHDDSVEVGVADQDTDGLIIGITTVPDDQNAAMIVKHLTKALNSLFGHPQDDSQPDLPIPSVDCEPFEQTIAVPHITLLDPDIFS